MLTVRPSPHEQRGWHFLQRWDCSKGKHCHMKSWKKLRLYVVPSTTNPFTPMALSVVPTRTASARAGTLEESAIPPASDDVMARASAALIFDFMTVTAP